MVLGDGLWLLGSIKCLVGIIIGIFNMFICFL